MGATQMRTPPMNAERTRKSETIETLAETFGASELVVVTQPNGLTVAEVTDLRRKLRAAGAGYKVAKNRLALLALKGTKFEGISAMFKGVTAIAYSSDPVVAAKIIADYAKGNEKLKIIGAGLGDKVLTDQQAKQLASLPGINELRAKLLGLLQTPATRIASVLKAPPGQLARVLSAYAKKGS